MTDDRSAPEPATFTTVDPYALTRRELAATQIKRFYKEATIVERNGGFQLMLDGRAAKTPGRNDLLLPTQGIAQTVAAEWNRQGEVMLPGDIPMTRLINTAIDGVARNMEEVRAELVRFAGSDLVFYRADAPADLVARQAAEWDPVLDWANETFGARFYLAEGVMFVQQPESALAAVELALSRWIGEGPSASFRLGALHVMTTLMGSVLLGLGVAHQAWPAEDAWRKAHLDEDFQIERWGQDAEAAERRQGRWREMSVAAELAAVSP